jgi:nicotinamidase-related amidase
LLTALLVIDAQVGLLELPGTHEPARVLERIAMLLARARAASVPVIFVQDDDVAPPGSAAWQVHPAIAPAPGEPAIRKTACDSFHETALAAALAERGVGRVVIAGMKTEFCIDTTCRRATTLGYHVALAADAHTTDGSDVLAAPTVIAHHNRLLHGFGTNAGEIVVAPSAEIDLAGPA